MAAARSIAPALLARARLVRGIVPNVTVAAMLGLGEGEFYRRRQALGLSAGGASPRRSRAGGKKKVPQDPPRRQARASGGLALASHGGAIDRLAVGRAMERCISERVAACEAAAGDDPEPERTARTLAHYARALGLVRDYLSDIEKERSSDAEQPVRTLSELRDELRGHLERIWDEGADAGGFRGAGAGPGGD